jgi:cytochrome c553
VVGYFAKTMRDYKSELRGDPVRSSIAETLTDAEIEDLAAFISPRCRRGGDFRGARPSHKVM